MFYDRSVTAQRPSPLPVETELEMEDFDLQEEPILLEELTLPAYTYSEPGPTRLQDELRLPADKELQMQKLKLKTSDSKMTCSVLDLIYYLK